MYTDPSAYRQGIPNPYYLRTHHTRLRDNAIIQNAEQHAVDKTPTDITHSEMLVYRAILLLFLAAALASG